LKGDNWATLTLALRGSGVKKTKENEYREIKQVRSARRRRT
jgi:hypothetical protein